MKFQATHPRPLALTLLPCLLGVAVLIGSTFGAPTAFAVAQSAPPAAPENPTLTRSVIRQDADVGAYFNLTLRADHLDHCVLFFSLAPREQVVELPPALGGSVTLGLGSVAIFASTADGRIKFSDRGVWTHQLVVPEPLVTFVRRLNLDFSIYLQAVSFRRSGQILKPHVSEVLALPLSERFETTRLGSALERLRQKKRGTPGLGLPIVPDRVRTGAPLLRRDVFGNRIFRSRRSG